MADIIRLGAIPDAEETLALLLDLRQRLEAGEDIGPRTGQIRQVSAALRAQTSGLRRLLDAPDETLAANPEIKILGDKVLSLAERNLAKAEELLRLVADRPA